ALIVPIANGPYNKARPLATPHFASLDHDIHRLRGLFELAEVDREAAASVLLRDAVSHHNVLELISQVSRLNAKAVLRRRPAGIFEEAVFDQDIHARNEREALTVIAIRDHSAD